MDNDFIPAWIIDSLPLSEPTPTALFLYLEELLPEPLPTVNTSTVTFDI